MYMYIYHYNEIKLFTKYYIQVGESPWHNG